MNDRLFNDLLRSLLGSLLLTGSMVLRAQCPGPFNLECRNQIDVALNNDCQALLSPALGIIGLPNCLADSNFFILVEDGDTSNGALADGVGSFTYTVQGQQHPALEGFNCSGTINLVDAAPPEILLSPGDIERGCNLRSQADVNLLADEVSRCWIVEGDTGLPRPGSLDGRLRQALLSGGGIPTVFDACGGDVDVCVTDAFDHGPATECIDTVLLQRAFTARSVDGDPNFAPAFRAQNIRFIRPRIAQIQGIPDANFVTCTSGLPPINPLPRATDYPFFTANTGPIHLNEGFCELLVDYIDGERLSGCGGSFTFIRTFRVRDWCASGADTAFTQIVRVGDHRGPAITPPTQDFDFDGLPDTGPLRFRTNTDDCSAIIDLRAGLTAADACAPSFSLEAFLYPDGDLTATPLGPYRLIGGFTNSLSDPLAMGNYLLRYVGRDNCGNTSIADVNVEIQDGTPPVALCRENFSIRLNLVGFSTLPASSFDDGSSDSCGEALNFLIATTNPDGSLISTPAGLITFNCANLGPTPVVLFAVDAAGNQNSCFVDVQINDEHQPTCTAPASLSLNCQDFSLQLPQDLEAAFALDPAATSALLNAAFGAAIGQDNCGVDTLAQTITGNLNECGVGQFRRLFTVSDAGGLVQQEVCEQLITVSSYTEYSLRFPGDSNYECSDLPTPEDITGPANGCELMVVNTFRDTLDESPAGACYALRLTYEVINWCEYDGLSQAIVLPRDADNDGDSSEPLFLHVVANSPSSTDDDQAILDQDDQPGNSNDLGQLTVAYGTSARRGFFVYEQIIGVFDTEAPVLTSSTPDQGLAFTQDCLGGVTLNFTATDACGFARTSVSIDELVVDRNDDGVLTSIDFANEYDVPESRFEGDPETGIEVPVRNLPIGQHLARIRSTDFCGNVSESFVLMEVVDGRPPEPLCLAILSVELAADPITGGTNVVYASDFVAGPATTCTQTEVSYALYPEEQASESGFAPAPGDLSLTVDCADLGESVLRLYAFAENTGLSGFCNVVLVVTEDNDLCADRNGLIEGLIYNEEGEALRAAEVITTGPTTLVTFTDGAGRFSYDGLEEGVGYEVRPYLNRNALNGLSTADLNIIGRYLFGFDDGLSPYQLIAADANNNGNITVPDLLMIREIVLGVEDDFDNNTSWRFVPADYAFPDPANPWVEQFPETILIDNLQGSSFAEFIAIKIGDVTGNANPQNNFGGGNTTEANARAAGVALTLRPTEVPGIWGLFAPENDWGANAGAREGITAMQATLQLPVGATVLPGILSKEEYRVSKGNVLRFSHVSQEERISSATPLLRFQLSDDDLPELIRPELGLQPEAYTADYQTLPLKLLLQETVMMANSPLRASPNPFLVRTRLVVDWPWEESVSIRVYDSSGREVLQRKETAFVGSNRYTIDSDELGDTEGLFLVQIKGTRGGEQLLKLVKR